MSVAAEDSLPSALRASNPSVQKFDLYSAPYETSRSHQQLSSRDSMTNDFAEFGVQDSHNRRTSYPVCSLPWSWYHTDVAVLACPECLRSIPVPFLRSPVIPLFAFLWVRPRLIPKRWGFQFNDYPDEFDVSAPDVPSIGCRPISSTI